MALSELQSKFILPLIENDLLKMYPDMAVMTTKIEAKLSPSVYFALLLVSQPIFVQSTSSVIYVARSLMN